MKLGPYDIVKRLGAGSMGQVYLAWHPILNQHYAIKVISGAQDYESLKRFERELQAVGQLKHPNVVSIHTASLSNPQAPYYVMDYVKGQDLSSYLAQGPLKLEVGLKLVRQLARGLAECHQKGIVHRDLKPANILVDEDLTPKITDFGLVSIAEANERLTRTGDIIGTPVYMAPEQARAEKLDFRVDIYALGVIMFECLTGQTIIPVHDAIQVMRQVAQGKIRNLSEFPGVFPESVIQVQQQACAFNKENRFQSASEFVLAIDAILAQKQDVTQVKETAKRQWLSRKLLVYGGISTVALCLLISAVFVWGAWQNRQFNRQKFKRCARKIFDIHPEEIDADSLETLTEQISKLTNSGAIPADDMNTVRGRAMALYGRQLIESGKLEAGYEKLKAASTLSPNDLVVTAQKLGAELMLGNRIKSGRTDLEKYQSKYSTDKRAHLWRAIDLVNTGQFDLALSHALSAAKAGYDTAAQQYQCYKELRNFDSALKVAEANPGRDWPDLANCYYRWLNKNAPVATQHKNYVPRLRAFEILNDDPSRIAQFRSQFKSDLATHKKPLMLAEGQTTPDKYIIWAEKMSTLLALRVAVEPGFVKTLEYLQLMNKLHTRNVSFMSSGTSKQIYNQTRRLAEIMPTPEAHANFLHSAQYQATNLSEFEAVKREFAARLPVLKQSPTAFAAAVYYLAYWYYRQQQFDSAEDLISNTLVLETNKPDMRAKFVTILGSIYLSRNEIKAAIEVLRKVNYEEIKFAPESHEVRTNYPLLLIRCYILNKQFDKAIEIASIRVQLPDIPPPNDDFFATAWLLKNLIPRMQFTLDQIKGLNQVQLSRKKIKLSSLVDYIRIIHLLESRITGTLAPIRDYWIEQLKVAFKQGGEAFREDLAKTENLQIDEMMKVLASVRNEARYKNTSLKHEPK